MAVNTLTDDYRCHLRHDGVVPPRLTLAGLNAQLSARLERVLGLLDVGRDPTQLSESAISRVAGFGRTELGQIRERLKTPGYRISLDRWIQLGMTLGVNMRYWLLGEGDSGVIGDLRKRQIEEWDVALIDAASKRPAERRADSDRPPPIHLSKRSAKLVRRA